MGASLEENITRYMEAGFPILYVNTYEEDKADRAILAAAKTAGRDKHMLEWNGFHAANFRTKAPLGIRDESLRGTLKLFLDDDTPQRILVLKEPKAAAEDPESVALLRDIALRIVTDRLEECTVIIVSSGYQIPQEIEHYVTVLEPKPLTYGEIEALIRRTAEKWEADLDEDSLEDMSIAFKGLTESEIVNILKLAAYQFEGALDKRALDMIFEQKRQTIKKSGILEMIEVTGAGMDQIGGLERLKEWLIRKSNVFKNLQKAEAFGVEMPKGVLIAGVPGCGKSLSAKATASMLNVPLLRMDMGRLLGKYVGESEGNMRRAIALAEAISPCVLWIDEMEKAFAGVGSESGGGEVTTRLLGTFLTWLQEKKEPVFVVATANDIRKLPPELLRKGRLDEIFYVGLPSQQEREKILEIHLKKRRPQDLGAIDLTRLARETDQYSGADLEGIVRDSIEMVFAAGGTKVTTADIERAMRETHPLSEVMKDDLKKMQDEYEKRKYKNASK